MKPCYYVRRLCFTFVLFLGFAASFAFAELSSSAPKNFHPNELSIALNAEFDTLNPVINAMMAAVYVQDSVLRPLVALTPEGKPYPVLIKEIPSLENHKMKLIKVAEGKGPTALSAQFEILAEAKWGDGEPVICEDIRAAWLIGKHPNVSAPAKDDFSNIEEISADSQNPKLCTVLFKKAQWNFYLNFPRPLAAHLELKIFEKHKDQPQAYERNSLYVREPTNPGLYNGPYRVTEIKIGNHVSLAANSFFYGTKPYFQKVIFKFILNSSSMEANLRTGAIQIASSSGLSFDQALAFGKKVKKENLPFQVIFVPGVVYAHLALNLDNEKLKDKQVRQALAYALNRKEMTQAFFEGKQPPAFHFSTPLDSWYTEDPELIKVYKYDKAKSNQLLDQAGWKKGPQGFRYKDGKKLSLTISGVSDYKLNEMIEVFIQSAWKQVGVELLIKNYPARVLFSSIVRERKFEIGFYSWVNLPDDILRGSLHSSMIPTLENSWSGSNRSGWRNKQVDEWLDQTESEFDPKKRLQLMHKVLKAYTEDLPAIPGYYRTNVSVIPVGLKNYRMSGHVYTEYLNIEKWSY